MSRRSAIGYRLLLLGAVCATDARATPKALPNASQTPQASPQSQSKIATYKPTWSQGSLGKEAGTLSSEWAQSGSVQRLRPRMLEQGSDLPVVLPEDLLTEDTEDCTTIAVLGTPNVSFLLAFDQEKQAPSRRAWPVPSAAGVAEVTRCGARKSLLSGLSVRMRSRRGIVEFVVLRSSHPPRPVAEILPHRNAGPSLPGPQVGKRPWLAPLKTRIELKKKHYLSRAAAQVLVSAASADQGGRGSFVVHLSEGCHRLDLLGEATSDAPPDLDARLTSLTQAEQLESDEEHSGQASLTYCVGRAERFRVEFSGAPAGDEVTLLHAQWDLPEGIPINWGPVARAELARSLFDTGFPNIDEAPCLSALGVRGTTGIRAEVDPEACYVLAIAPLRGESQRFALGAELSHSLRESQSLHAGHGASLQFCAQNADFVSLETQAVGDGLAWILGLWRIGTPPVSLPTIERTTSSSEAQAN